MDRDANEFQSDGQDLSRELRTFLRHPRQRPRTSDPETAWQRVASAVGLEGRAQRAISKRRIALGIGRNPGLRWGVPMLGVAALAILLAVATRYSGFPPRSMKARTITTSVGQRVAVTLGDGTHVTLAPQTAITITSRDIVLVGEAYFVVPHHTATPFVVRTGSITTHVLGTAFDVRRYKDDPSTLVAVAEGRVTSGGARQAILIAGRVARVTDSTIVMTPASDVADYTSWTRGRLAFSNIPARELLKTVGRWYGLQFQLADSALGAEPISVRFEGQSVTGVLAILRAVLDVDMTFDGSLVTLRPNTHGRLTPSRRETRDVFSTSSHEAGR